MGSHLAHLSSNVHTEKDVAWSRVLNFDDPFAFSASMQTVNSEVIPTAPGLFKGELKQVRFDRIWMQRFDINLPQISTGVMAANRKAFAFASDPSSAHIHYRGIDISQGEIATGFDHYHLRSGPNLRLASLSLPSDEFSDICEALIGEALSDEREFVRPDPALLARLSRLHEAIGLMALEAPDDILQLPEVERALEQQAIHLLIRCLAEGSPPKPRKSFFRHNFIIAQLEDFLASRHDQPVYLTEICRALRVSERTLRQCCEEHLGMGPIRYLTLRRMHLVRRSLQSGRNTTVTKVVTDCGFWELGRFSAAYRAMFGERPSDTLRKARTAH